jgi:hypothetical protein
MSNDKILKNIYTKWLKKQKKKQLGEWKPNLKWKINESTT